MVKGFGVVKSAMVLGASLLALALGGCNTGDQPLQARTGAGDSSGNDGKDSKPGTDPKEIVEARRPLLLQRPTLDEAKFLNILQVKFGTADQAAFTFTYAPEEAGSLFFSNIQSRLHLEGCDEAKNAKRVVKFNVVWQEDNGAAPRKRLKDFTPDITEYEFVAGKKYFLTYALLDLKNTLADCESAAVKMAVFQKKYSKDPP